MRPSGRPSMRTSAVTMPAPKPRRSSSTEPVVGERLDHARGRRRRAAGSRGSTSRSRRWSAHVHVGERALEVATRYCFATAHRLGLVGDRDVDDAVRRLHRRSGRPRRAGRRRARRPRSSPGRPCRSIEFSRRDDHVAAAEQRGVAGEAAARRRCRRAAPGPRAARSSAKARHVEAGDAERSRCRRAGRRRPRRRTRPAAASSLGQLEHAVLLAVVLSALRAGEHGVVVGEHHAARALARRSRSPLTRADAGDQAVGRACAAIRSSQRRGAGAARRSRGAPYSTKMPGSQRSATFSRAVRWPVLRRRSPRPRAAPRRASARGARMHLGEIGADGVEVDAAGPSLPPASATVGAPRAARADAPS